MKHLSNEHGVLPIVVAILVVVVLTVAGLAVYSTSKSRNKMESPKASPTASASPSPSTSPIKTASPSPSPSSATGYLEITSWGVKLPATGLLANLKYQIVNGLAIFYTSELYPKYKNCGPSGGLGGLTRYPHGTQAPSAIAAGTINGYDYFFSESQQPCAQGSQADEQLNTDQQNALIEEMRGLKLTAF